MLFGECSHEPLQRPRDDLDDPPAVHDFAFALLLVGNFRPDDIARKRTAVFTLGDKKVFVPGRIGRYDKPKATAVVAITAHDSGGFRFLGRQHHAAPGAQHDAPRVHQLAQRLAKTVVLEREIQILSQSFRLLWPILIALEMTENFRIKMFRH